MNQIGRIGLARHLSQTGVWGCESRAGRATFCEWLARTGEGLAGWLRDRSESAGMKAVGWLLMLAMWWVFAVVGFRECDREVVPAAAVESLRVDEGPGVLVLDERLGGEPVEAVEVGAPGEVGDGEYVSVFRFL